jgi:hypothetical protein
LAAFWPHRREEMSLGQDIGRARLFVAGEGGASRNDAWMHIQGRSGCPVARSSVWSHRGSSGRGGRVFGVEIMSRVIAVIACGFSLAACSSWMPSFDMPGFGASGEQSASIAVESDPPGAEARASSGGQSCRTPCRLNVAADGPFTVSVALNGYVPQSVPVRVMQPEDPRLGSQDGASNASARLDPNPIFVELERAPPAVPASKKKPTAHRPVAAMRAPTTAAGSGAPPPAAQQPIQPASSSTAPWPMPR